MTKRFMSPRETSEYLGIKPKTIYSLAARGMIPAVRFGRQLRIDLIKLDEYIDQQCPAVRSTCAASPHGVRPGRSGIYIEGKHGGKVQT